jgi:hypothetical protein
MPICRICQYNNPPLAIACQQCGVHLDKDVLQSNRTPTQGTKLPLPVFTLCIGATEVSLTVCDDTVAIMPDNHIYIGREFPNNFSNAHLDLGPFSARDYGVSRIHARIEHDLFGYYRVVDLGSTNGTLLNNELLTAFRNYPLDDDDLLSFGDFPILVHIVA